MKKKNKNKKDKINYKEIIKKYKDKTVEYFKRVKREHLIKKYFKNNILFITFILTCLINSTMLRFFTMHTMENYLAIKPVIADLSILIIFGSFGYLFKPKNRFVYFLCMDIFFSAICMVNSIYYTFYTSFASASMLSLTQFIGPVGNAVVENVLQIKDLLYILGPIVLIVVHILLKKKNYYKKIELKKERKNRTIKSLITGGILVVIFTITLTPLEIGRFTKQWNREYIVMKFGIYIYQFNDLVVSLQPKINSMFGYDNAVKNFKTYFEENPNSKSDNKYTNIFEGKNVIVIHAESMQNDVINMKFNDQEVTPNLNKLTKTGMYFSNFYSQVSVGTSSDTELTFNTSLMPTQNGTAFVSYFDRTYIATPQLMKDKGYYTFSMHANNADFWNRRVMHENLGYEKFYSKETFDVNKDNLIGLGLSDESFFAQSVEKLKKIKQEHGKFYGTFITLSNHTPFSDVDKYGDFAVDIKETVTNDDGTTQEVVHPYMEGTKLGNYFKSVHYADKALGEFFQELDDNGLLDNTVVVLYGDHDARLSKKDYVGYYNYDTKTDSVKDETDPTYINFDNYQYELNRKVPFVIWTKDMESTDLNEEVKNVMGMYDVMPTLGNMFNFYNQYALGHDIFTIKDDNVVVFPNGNWVSNNIYYNSQKEEYLSLNDNAVSQEYIEKVNDHTEKLLNVSNDMIVFNLLKKDKNEQSLLNSKGQ